MSYSLGPQEAEILYHTNQQQKVPFENFQQQSAVLHHQNLTTTAMYHAQPQQQQFYQQQQQQFYQQPQQQQQFAQPAYTTSDGTQVVVMEMEDPQMQQQYYGQQQGVPQEAMYFEPQPYEVNTMIPESQPVGTEMGAEEEEGAGEHLSVKDFKKGVLERDLFVHIETSLNELAQNEGKAIWKPNAEELKKLRQVTALQNRDNAKEEDIVGDLSRCIPLELQVMEYGSGCPRLVGADIYGMRKTKSTGTSSHTWIFPATKTEYRVKSDECITQPTNVIDKIAYKTWRKVDLDSVGDEVHYDKKNNVALVDTSGVVFAVFKDNMLQGAWKDLQLPVGEILDAEKAGVTHLSLPPECIRNCEEHIRPFLENIDQSFHNWNNFFVEFKIADGAQSWNDTRRGLVGEQMNTGKTRGVIDNRALNKRFGIWMRLKAKYVLY